MHLLLKNLTSRFWNVSLMPLIELDFWLCLRLGVAIGYTLPISVCGLHLDDEAIRVAIGFRLGARICEPHSCPCGAQVDVRGIHSLSCRRSAGRTSRHHNLSDII